MLCNHLYNHRSIVGNRMPTFMTHPMQIQALCYIIPQVKARCLVLITSVSVIFSTSKIGDGTATNRGYQAIGGHGPHGTHRRQDRRPSYWHLLCQQDPWHPVEEASWTPAPWRDQV